DLRGLLRGRPRTLPGVDLVLTDPLAQRLGGADAQFLRDGLQCRGLGRVVAEDLGDHAHRAAAQLKWGRGGSCHDSNPYMKSSIHSNRGGSNLPVKKAAY